MPRATFSDDYVAGGQVEGFPALKLENTGDLVRLAIPDEEGWFEYVHSMRAPVIDEEGYPVIVTKSRKDKSTYDDFNFGFVGQRICLGDPAVIEDKKIDPDRCPACAASRAGVKDMAPVRRFALPVIQYNVKRRTGTDLQNPPGAQVKVWKLSQNMFNLLRKQVEHIRNLLDVPEDQPVTLRMADIVVECEDAGFQRLSFQPPLRPAWKHPAVGQLIKELWEDVSNRPTDAQLKAACGRDNDDPEARAWMEKDVALVTERWTAANKHGKDFDRIDPTGAGAISGGNLNDQLTVILDDPFGGQPVASAAQVPAASSGLGEFSPVTTSNPADRANDPFGGSTRAAAPVNAEPGDDNPFEDTAAAPAPAGRPAAAAQTFDEIFEGTK